MPSSNSNSTWHAWGAIATCTSHTFRRKVWLAKLMCCMSGSSSTVICARNAHITLNDITTWSWVNLVNPDLKLFDSLLFYSNNYRIFACKNLWLVTRVYKHVWYSRNVYPLWVQLNDLIMQGWDKCFTYNTVAVFGRFRTHTFIISTLVGILQRNKHY